MPALQRKLFDYAVPVAVVAEILGFIRDSPFNTVHYLGHADESLVRAISSEERYVLSLMDYWDRHQR